jgi:hypothetical protein
MHLPTSGLVLVLVLRGQVEKVEGAAVVAVEQVVGVAGSVSTRVATLFLSLRTFQNVLR